jgi:uncharacterized protein (TIGR04255 family)
VAFNFSNPKKFPQLARPPIVEAVIHWRAKAQAALDPSVLGETLLSQLSEFKRCESIRDLHVVDEVADDDSEPSVQHRRKSEWQGLRLVSEDGRHVAQFTRDGVIFSCTRNYEDWDRFTAAAMRVWRLYLEIAKPLEVERLGVRFINQFSSATPDNLANYLVEPPTRVSNLPIKEFVYQSVFVVPQAPFEARVIKLMQPSIPETSHLRGLIVDIDVYSTTATPNDETAIREALAKFRVLKNEIFFTLIHRDALASCGAEE